MNDSYESKTLALLYIAQILYTETDSEHKITQAALIDKLDCEHNIAIERKTVGRHLDALRAMGFDIVTSPKGSWWNEEERTFSDGELRYLIDSVLFSKHLSATDAEHLMKKLRKIGTISMQNKIKLTANSVDRRSVNERVFDSIDRINQAIEMRKQISFTYSQYDLKLHLQPSESKITVSPLRLVPHNGHYYLVAKQEDKTSFEFYRVERMNEVYGVDTKSAEPIKIEEVDKYLRTHPYLTEGYTESCEVLLAINKLDDFVDAFGTALSISKKTDTLLDVTFQANANDLYLWAVQNCVFVEVLRPYSVRTRLRNVSAVVKVKYNRTSKDSYDNAIQKAFIDGELVLEHIDIREHSQHREMTGCGIVALNDVHAYDVDFLKGFEKLRRFSVCDTPVNSLKVLANKQILRTVKIVNTNIRSIEFLRTLPCLAVVYLIDNENLTDYDVLYDLPNLKQIVVDPSVQLDKSRIRAELIVDTRDKINVSGVIPALRPSARLLSAIFKNYEGFSIREIPPVYTEANDDRFYEFLQTILSPEDYEFLRDCYDTIIGVSCRAERLQKTKFEIEKERKRIIGILQEPANLNTILQIYFA